MIEGAQGSRLFNTRPTDTADTLAFTATLNTELTKLLVCNTTGGAVTFRFYHLPEGVAVSSLDYALWYDKSVAANDTFIFGGETGNGGIQLEEGDTILVRSATANALAFQGYGITASIAPEQQQGQGA